jgi:hypothetical protein
MSAPHEGPMPSMDFFVCSMAVVSRLRWIHRTLLNLQNGGKLECGTDRMLTQIGGIGSVEERI